MAGDANVTVGGSQLIGIAGGTINVGLITMSHASNNYVGLTAAGDILDANLGDSNIQESTPSSQTEVSLRAGGQIGSSVGNDAPDNVHALELAVDRVAAESAFGIYLHQVASGLDLVISDVSSQSVSISGVQRSEFNGTTSNVPTVSDSVAGLARLVTTVNGEIELVVDGGDLTFVDGVGVDGPDLKGDPEVLASGVLGRIDLRALDSGAIIDLGDNVQFHADKITAEYSSPTTRPMPLGGLSRQDRAIYLKSDSIVLGTDVELFTGMDQGTARLFTPRPIEYIVNDDGTTSPLNGVFPAESAFYDASTVSASDIVQVDEQYIGGTLFIDVGTSGERGLTVDIDWGAETRRYQQINGLAADSDTSVGVGASGQPLTPVVAGGTGALSVEHYYTDMDIVFSRENGRSEVASPLEVRFSVRHHESILVEAGAVQQGMISETVSGGVVSSTDDPTTPPGTKFGLESGHHRFKIPNVPDFSVPFLPQREVIPHMTVATFLPAVELESVAMEVEVRSTVASGFVAVARDEYFQLRALRPDQNAEPYGVFRLSDDIMTGGNLLQLQQSLPDGSYEIEYVLGDTFSRVILRFDVRNGEPIIPENALDEGELLLQEIREEQQLEEDTEGTKIDDQTRFEIQPGVGVEPIGDASHDSVVSYHGEMEVGTFSAESAEGENDANGNVEIREFVEEAELGAKDAVNLTNDQDVDLSRLPAFPVGVVLTTALQRRRQNSQKRKLSRAARFAARKTGDWNFHDSEGT